MRLLYSLIIIPLLAGVLAFAAFVWVSETEPGLLNEAIGDYFEAAIVAGVVFCLALTILNHLSISLKNASVAKSLRSIAGYEKDIRRRLENPSVELPDSDRLGRIETRLKRVENQFGTAVLSSGTKHLSKTPDFAEDEGSKVVSIETAKRTQKSGKTMSPDASDTKFGTGISKHIKNGQVKMYLQPIVTLPDRQVPAYEVLANVEHEDGTHIAIASLVGSRDDKDFPQIDKLMLEKAIGLLRKLQREDRKATLFWNISNATLNRITQLEVIAEMLEANRKVAGNLVAEISLADFNSLTKKQLSALSRLRSLGIGIALERCKNRASALRALESGLFSHLKFPAELMAQFEDENTESEGYLLVESLDAHAVELIATHVETERQVLDLLDCDIRMAQGKLFSEPRPLQLESASR